MGESHSVSRRVRRDARAGIQIGGKDTRGRPYPLAEQQDAEQIVRSAGVVSLAVFTSRITGLIREIVMARLFGASMAYDAFLLGFRIPNLTRDLFGEGALSSAFIPTFTEYLTQKGKQAAARLAHLVTTAQLIIVGGFCLIGILLSPQLVELLAPGFKAVPGKFELAVRMTRIMFPFLLLVSLAALAMGILNACNRFAIPALASSWFNVGSLLIGLMLGVWAGPVLGISAIEGMAYGVVAGGLIQLLWQLPSLHRAGFRLFRWETDWADPGLRKILRLMGPAILGAAAVQINVMVNTNFASRIVDPVSGPDGPVSWLSYAFRFMQLPLGLFGVAMASATLPAISRSAACGDVEEFRRTLARSLGLVFLLSVPSSVGLVVLGETVVGAIYEGGRFRPYDTHQTAVAVAYYAVGLAGYSAIKILTPAFYALGDARTPMTVSLLSIAINFCAVVLLIEYTRLGHAGLALSTSVVALFGFLMLFTMLRGKLHGIKGWELLSSTLRIIGASAVMGVIVYALNHEALEWFGTGRPGRLLALAICVPAGAGLFYLLCRAMRVPELELASGALLGPVLRRLRG